jgi:hypothetical protein
MKVQNYKNHRLFYAPHHFVFYPLILIFAAAGAWCSFHYQERSLEFAAITAIFCMLGWLSYMTRQHYAIGIQNRVIRLELRLRYFQLTGKTFEPIEQQLTLSQMIALRFASDEELIPLIEQSISRNLSPKEIKKSIHSWKADYMRI